MGGGDEAKGFPSRDHAYHEGGVGDEFHGDDGYVVDGVSATKWIVDYASGLWIMQTDRIISKRTGL